MNLSTIRIGIRNGSYEWSLTLNFTLSVVNIFYPLNYHHQEQLKKIHNRTRIWQLASHPFITHVGYLHSPSSSWLSSFFSFTLYYPQVYLLHICMALARFHMREHAAYFWDCITSLKYPPTKEGIMKICCD